jgi:hypothetical protein
VNRALDIVKQIKGDEFMEIYKIDNENILTVAEFMSNIKPEWWDFEGATEQLSKGTGWYFGVGTDKPTGWLLCKSYEDYRAGEIECLGYDRAGVCEIGEELQPLVEKSEEWARKQGFVIMRFTIGTRGLSCHERALKKPWEELRDIHAINRDDYNWFISMGYVPSGVLPNIYGEKQHGIMLVKTL